MKPNDQNAVGLRDLLDAVQTFIDGYRAQYMTGKGVRANAPMRSAVGELRLALVAAESDLRSLLSRLEKAEQGSSNASRAAMGPQPHVATEAEPSAPRGPCMSEQERAAWRIALIFYGEAQAYAAEFARDERWDRCWSAAQTAQGRFGGAS